MCIRDSGIGVPPMLACVKKAAGEGVQPRAVLGFRNKDAVILEDDFKAVCEAFVTTDDGSYARHGFVTDVLKELVADATGVAACGPKPMLKAIAAIADEAGLPCQVSMEERMGCGIGACLEMCIRDSFRLPQAPRAFAPRPSSRSAACR